MNRVQTVTQKYHRVENQFEKPSRMHKHPTGPTGTPRCALALPGARTPGRIVGRPGRVVAEAPCRIAAPAAVWQRPCAPCHERLAPRPCAPCPACVAGLHGRIMSASRPCRRRSCRVAALRARVSRPSTQRSRTLRSHVRPACPACLATIQYFVLQPKISQTKPLSHNISSVLRYTFCLAYPLPVAIQGLISQYNPLLNQIPSSHLSCNTNLVLQYNSPLAYSSCNTIWAVAQLKSTQFFFFRFS